MDIVPPYAVEANTGGSSYHHLAQGKFSLRFSLILVALSAMNLSNYQGQILIGTLIATALWGMQCIQTFFYFETYKSDKWYFKALVAVLCVLNSVHEILCAKASWSTVIPKFGGITNAGTAILPPELFYQVVVMGVVATLTHFFFVWRIWRFTEKRIFLMIMIPPSIGPLVCAFWYTAKAIGNTESFLSSPTMKKLALGMVLMETPVDMFIAVVMCIMLWKSRTGLPRTDRMVLRLINLSISTGACLAICGIVGLITLLRWPDDLFYWTGEITATTLYCNAVTASLNSRKYIADTDVMVDPFGGGIITGYSLSIGSFTARRDLSQNVVSNDRGAGDSGSNVIQT